MEKIKDFKSLVLQRLYIKRFFFGSYFEIFYVFEKINFQFLKSFLKFLKSTIKQYVTINIIFFDVVGKREIIKFIYTCVMYKYLDWE